MKERRILEARRFVESSGIGLLVSEVNHMLRFGNNYLKNRLDQDSLVIGESIEQSKSGVSSARKYTNLEWDVEVTPEGTIAFYSGTSRWDTIRRDQWERDPKALEKALEKVYRHPGKVSGVRNEDVPAF